MEVGAMAANAELNGITEVPPSGLSLPRVPEPADENDVLREQLEYLIGHATERGVCGCSDCQRFLRVRSALLEIFTEPEPQQVHHSAATLPMAA